MAHEIKANTLVKADPDEIHVVIPDGIKVIDERAFKDHPNMETLEIPESVTRIGIFCFADAHKLRSVVIHGKIKSVPHGGFYKCVSLEEVSLPESVEYIAEAAFSDCESLRKINFPSKLKKIEDRAFSHCKKLPEIIVPDNVEKIGTHAFYGCENARKAVIPDSVKNIGDGAFAACSGIPEVSISEDCHLVSGYKGKYTNFDRNTKVTVRSADGKTEHKIDLSSMSATKKTKKNEAMKTTQESVINSGKIQFGDDVTLELPESFCYADTTDEKGNRVVIIGLDPQDEAGKTVYNYQVAVKMVEKRIPGEDILDYIDELFKEAYGRTRTLTVPEYSTVMMKKQSELDNSTVVIRATANNIRLSESQVLSVQIPGGETGEDTGYFLTEQSANEAIMLYKVLKTILIRGRKLIEDGVSPNTTSKNYGGIKNKQTVGVNDFKDFWAFDDQNQMIRDGRVMSKLLFEAINGGNNAHSMDAKKNKATAAKQNEQPKTQKAAETPVTDRNSPIYRDGNRLVFGNLWSMEMPYACRLVKSVLSDNEAKNYSIYNGDKEMWNFIIANSVEQQSVKALANTIVYMTLKKFHSADDLISWQFRKDDCMSVDMKLAIGMDGHACGQLTVDAKGHQYIMITEMPEIDDIQEGLNAINNDEIGMMHPFGLAWENQWSIILRMITSIRPVNEKDDSLKLRPAAELYEGISCQLPQGLTEAGMEDGSKVYIFSETGSDKKTDRSNAPLTVYIHGSKLDGSLEKQKIELFFKAFAMQQGKGFGLTICDDHEEGFYKNYSYYPHANGAVRIHALKDSSTDLSIALIPGDADDRLPQNKIISMANAIFESLHLSSGNEQETIPETLVPAADYMHEHFDLIESHCYTTHRSADFIGQPIRELMKKHDEEKQEAYGLMKIRDDDYSLDQEAIRLAKVFRLEEDLFDQYNDTEALIRKGMFSDAGMYHALRSLAWTVSRMADRGKRDLSDYDFNELERIGRLIKEKNYLNYWMCSYSAGLCDTYDWHVFFVPEHYLFTECHKNSDLRYLTGKENRGGNTISVFIPGMSGFGGANRNNDIISRNEETLKSLEALRKDLTELLPVMQTIYDGLLKNRDRTKKLEGPLADALTAWCALAIAAKEPFYSEEAADTPEADAALEEPLERPTDKLDDKPARKAKPEPKKDEKKETPKKSPAKQASKAGKAMKGASNDASYEQYLPKGTKLTPEETRYMTIIARLLTEKKKVNINDIAFETNETIEETKRVLSELRKKRVLGVTTYGNLEMWEPERRKKAATETVVPVSKKTGSRTETFYKRFTFELPDGYDLEREDDHRCVFYLNEHDDGTGTLVYDYLNTMTLENFTDLKPGESPVQRIRNSLYFTKDWYEISSEPETGILTEQGTFYKAGEPVDTYSMMYLYQLSDTEVLVFREKVMEGTKKDLSYHLDKYEHFLQAIGNICVDGKPVPAAGITAVELWDKVRAYRDVNYEEPGESRKKEEKKIKTKPAAKPEKIDYYDGTYGFALPAGYELEWFTEDGDRYCDIVHGPYYKENGKKDYQFSAQLSVNTANDALAGERPLQMIHRNNQDALFSTVSSNPNAEIMVKTLQINALGQTVKLYVIWLIVEKNTREFFLVHHQSILDEDRSKQLESYRGMIIAANALRINGKPIAELKESPETLMKKMPLRTDGNLHTLQGNVELNISVNITAGVLQKNRSPGTCGCMQRNTCQLRSLKWIH